MRVIVDAAAFLTTSGNSVLALLVARARTAFTEGGRGRPLERLTGAVMIGLGIRLALERH
jgi:threonine/homoserine/homoserine lactone efflux protein